MLKTPLFPSISALAEYEDQVSSFFRRATSKAEGEAALSSHSADLLKNIADLLPTIRECPAYAGMAFYGRLQAVDVKLIRRMAADGVASKVALEALRAGKALRVSAVAKAGWDLLKESDPDALWSAILLNMHRTPSTFTVAKAKDDDDEGDEDDGDERDQDEDEDDDN
jgi:hypothetical protein